MNEIFEVSEHGGVSEGGVRHSIVVLQSEYEATSDQLQCQRCLIYFSTVMRTS